jgi:XTP/dITP diphosphohydrolase
METLKILIATGNPGKFEEISSHFADLSSTFVSLKDVGLAGLDLEEPFETSWENALHKAKFFAEKSGLVTLAEDTAFYVHHLAGAPGVKAKRFGKDDAERISKIMNGLEGVPRENRQAYFEAHMCLYNPDKGSFTMFAGRVDGEIVTSTVGLNRGGMSYDTVFYYPPLQKTFAELSIAEKNTVSHRGKLAAEVKIFLQRQYSFVQIICPVGLIAKDRKLFLNKRRDSNPAMNNKWEFPGGGTDNGEEVEACVVREVAEETGFQVKIIDVLPKIFSTCGNIGTTDPYQVFLISHICEIIGGELALAEEESAGHGWFTLDEALELELLPLNKKIIQEHFALLKKYFD